MLSSILRRHLLVIAMGLIIFGGVVSLHGEEPPPLPPEARQFDFWIGEWIVTDPDGVIAGNNRIETIANGAGLLENWTGDSAQGGGTGKSLNTYNSVTKQWQQFWVGSGGSVLELNGGLNESGAMVLSGNRVARDGKPIVDRITWTPNPDGTVRQVWDVSRDAGTTWKTVFDGLYRRKE